MPRPAAHPERHGVSRIGWLRAAVLGANDGLVSTASLVIGIGAAGATREAILLAGLAGLVAGAMSMAAGEFVSVSSQADAEGSELRKEAKELAEFPDAEQAELAAIYRARGLTPETAAQVAQELMAHDALAAHARDELGLTEQTAARPLEAALASALMFAAGAVLPIIVVLVASPAQRLIAVVASALVGLALLGAAGARTGGAPLGRAVVRVVFWGALAMAATALIGRLAGTVI
ncbi:VIT1/CCC1 transporter family protein [Polymorphobacter sp.]|uniref:VIT1/CCC1 transporter family protein n=1 Tax=Polymorphobacter sp. TaxID=1909290 RepID=UPI003F71832F